MIDFTQYRIFTEHLSTLKELSKDDSITTDIKYMTDSEIIAINFDNVKTKYTNDLSLSEEVAASVDGICFFVSGEVFIEFKNGNMKGAKANVKNKLRDSLLIFCDITKIDISYARENIDFILVYNEQKNPIPNQHNLQTTQSRVSIAEHFLSKANEEFIRFDLERFKTLFFKNVSTYTESQFELYLSKQKIAN